MPTRAFKRVALGLSGDDAEVLSPVYAVPTPELVEPDDNRPLGGAATPTSGFWACRDLKAALTYGFALLAVAEVELLDPVHHVGDNLVGAGQRLVRVSVPVGCLWCDEAQAATRLEPAEGIRGVVTLQPACSLHARDGRSVERVAEELGIPVAWLDEATSRTLHERWVAQWEATPADQWWPTLGVRPRRGPSPAWCDFIARNGSSEQ